MPLCGLGRDSEGKPSLLALPLFSYLYHFSETGTAWARHLVARGPHTHLKARSSEKPSLVILYGNIHLPHTLALAPWCCSPHALRDLMLASLLSVSFYQDQGLLCSVLSGIPALSTVPGTQRGSVKVC